MLPIYVTTCDSYRHLLPEFCERFNTYWDSSRHVKIFGFLPPEEQLPDNFEFVSLGEDDGGWTGQMIKILERETAPYFIRLSEEFFISENVNMDLLANLEFMATMETADRIGLQTVHEGYDECSGRVGDTEVFGLSKNADYLCSLEASILSRETLLQTLDAGMHIWEAEVDLSKKFRELGASVFVTESRIITYKDAMRRGMSRAEGYEDIGEPV